MKITSPYRGRESRHIHNTSLITVFLYVFVLFSWKTKFTSKIGFIEKKDKELATLKSDLL